MPESPRLIVLLLIGLMATACDRQKAEAPQAAPVEGSVEAADDGKGVDRSHVGKAAPAVQGRPPLPEAPAVSGAPGVMPLAAGVRGALEGPKGVRSSSGSAAGRPSPRR